MTRRYRRMKKKTRKNINKKSRNSKKWITAFESASKTLKKTSSLTAANESLKKQAIQNARKLFGSV